MQPDRTLIAPPPSLRGPLTNAERDVLAGYLARMETMEQRAWLWNVIALIFQLGLAVFTVTYLAVS